MKNKFDITTSIVLYKEDLNELSRTIDCFLKTPLKKKLFLIDNTPTKEFEGVFNHKEIEYIPGPNWLEDLGCYEKDREKYENLDLEKLDDENIFELNLLTLCKK